MELHLAMYFNCHTEYYIELPLPFTVNEFKLM